MFYICKHAARNFFEGGLPQKKNFRLATHIQPVLSSRYLKLLGRGGRIDPYNPFSGCSTAYLQRENSTHNKLYILTKSLTLIKSLRSYQFHDNKHSILILIANIIRKLIDQQLKFPFHDNVLHGKSTYLHPIVINFIMNRSENDVIHEKILFYDR